MITRRTALEMSAVALGAVAVGGVVLGEHADPAVSAPSAKQDAEILNFALSLVRLASLRCRCHRNACSCPYFSAGTGPSAGDAARTLTLSSQPLLEPLIGRT